MPHYRYHAYDAVGASREGALEAPSLLEAAGRLRREGLSVRALDRRDSEPPPGPPTDLDAFVLFHRGLAEMTEAGLPLPEAVEEVARALARGRFRPELDAVAAKLREGTPIESALDGLPSEFNPAYRSLVKAGARSGRLSEVLHAVADLQEDLLTSRRRFLDALAYPAIVLVAGLGMYAALAAGLGSALREAFLQATHGAVGPPVTFRSVWVALAVSGVLAGGAGLAFVLGRRSIRVESALLRLPWLGGALHARRESRLYRALSAMLQWRVPLSEALPAAAIVAGGPAMRAAAPAWAARAGEGGGLGDVLTSGGVGPYGPGEEFLRRLEGSGLTPAAVAHLAETAKERADAGEDALALALSVAGLLVAGGILGYLSGSFLIDLAEMASRIPNVSR